MLWGYVIPSPQAAASIPVAPDMPFPPLGVLADRSAGYVLSVASDMPVRSAGYVRPPLGVPADLQSAVKKCPNLFMLWGYVIPCPQAIAGISMG